MPKFLLATDVAEPNSDMQSPGKSAIGFDGTNYLYISSRLDSTSDAIYGVIISEDGDILKTFDITPIVSWMMPRPAVAFDGTNYLVVYQKNGVSL